MKEDLLVGHSLSLWTQKNAIACAISSIKNPRYGEAAQFSFYGHVASVLTGNFIAASAMADASDVQAELIGPRRLDSLILIKQTVLKITSCLAMPMLQEGFRQSLICADLDVDQRGPLERGVIILKRFLEKYS